MALLLDYANIFTLIHREFYESFDYLVPNEADFIEPAKRHLGNDWAFSRREVWYHCRPSTATTPSQGWKIHLSTTLDGAAPLLVTACRVFREARVPFKFALDRFVLRVLNSKRWKRGGAGKFVTVYPTDTDQCASLLEALTVATAGFTGPYILSDRRYRDSAVVHYRYGGFSNRRRLGVTGERANILRLEDGGWAYDERLPYFRMPEGVEDPFVGESGTEDAPDGTLKQGRYLVESALAFGNSGGVYIAVDQERAERVIIKEARPHTTQSVRGTDAVTLLRKEHRLLVQLQEARIAPRALDFFRDWEHFYLVEELLEGESFRIFQQVALNLGLKGDPSVADVAEFVRNYCRVIVRVAEALMVLHERHIVFGDLSFNNIIIGKGGEEVRLIDFEGAHEHGVDSPPLLHTPGFAPREMVEDGVSTTDQDLYGLGAVMLAGLMPINPLLSMNPSAHEATLRAFVNDLGVPPELTNCIRGLLETNPSQRLRLPDVVRVLQGEMRVSVPHIGATEADEEDCDALVQRILSYIESMADYGRTDRLFPAAPNVFMTNPLNVAFGACGIAHVFRIVRGSVPTPVVEWIQRQPITNELYPPGLFIGLAGVSWVLLELGRRGEAERLIRMSESHPQLHESPDLYYGQSGWGLTQLRFFLTTSDEEYLEKAREVGDLLVERREEEDTEACWWSAQQRIHCGLGHGAAGVSLFLLYLYLATGDERYLDIGNRGLTFVRNSAITTAQGALSFRSHQGEPTTTPYWRWGSAGVGAVLLRYQAILNDERYAALLDGIRQDVDRKFSVFPGQHVGLAGMGEFLIDMAQLGGDSVRGIASARKVLSGLLHFKLERDTGVAFPGETRTRVSCDLSTGGAGVAHFIHRLQWSTAPLFMLDELLGDQSVGIGETVATGGLDQQPAHHNGVGAHATHLNGGMNDVSHPEPANAGGSRVSRGVRKRR